MPYLIGMILGDVLGRIGFFRAAGAALLLSATGFVAYRLAAANVGPDTAVVAGALAPLALFSWACWSPASSRFRLWIVDGVFLAARLAMWWAGIAFAFAIVGSGFKLGVWLITTWPWAVIAGVFWGVQWLLARLTARSHRIMGDRSVLDT